MDNTGQANVSTTRRLLHKHLLNLSVRWKSINEMRNDGPFDFGDRAFVPLLRDEGWEIAQDKDTWAFPPIETLFVQRKVSGTALLGAKLKAKANVRRITEEILASTKPLSAKAA